MTLPRGCSRDSSSWLSWGEVLNFNLATITQGIAELRNQFGTGHRKTAGAALQSRHAKLAVGAASNISCIFVGDHAARLK